MSKKRVATTEVTGEELAKALGFRPTVRVTRATTRVADDGKETVTLRLDGGKDDADLEEIKQGDPVPHLPLDAFRPAKAAKKKPE